MGTCPPFAKDMVLQELGDPEAIPGLEKRETWGTRLASPRRLAYFGGFGGCA
jgi:hypothetical protein